MIAVLGAGGPLGLECIQRLRELGLPARAVVREPAKYQCVFPAHTQVVAGDVTDEEALREALAGCAGVIFCASARGRWEAQAVSHLGAANTARVAKDLGAKVVLVSSRLANGRVFGWSPVRMVVNLATGGGMDAKMQGEDAVRASGAEYCVVRPAALVFGANAHDRAERSQLDPSGGDFIIAGEADSRGRGAMEYMQDFRRRRASRKGPPLPERDLRGSGPLPAVPLVLSSREDPSASPTPSVSTVAEAEDERPEPRARLVAESTASNPVKYWSISRMDAAAVAVAAVTDPLSAGRTIEVVARPRKLCDPPFEEHLQVLFTGLRPDTEVYPPPEEGPSFLSRCSRCLNCVGMGAAAEEDAPLFGPASATAGT